MKLDARSLIGLALVGLVVYSFSHATAQKANGTTPLSPYDAPIAAAMVGPSSSSDGLTYAAAFSGIADRLTADGLLSSPAVTDRATIARLVAVAGTVTTAGGTKYPGLPAVIAQAFTAGFGTDAGPLDAIGRAKAAAVCADLSNAFAKVK